MMKLTVNGRELETDASPETPLLWVLPLALYLFTFVLVFRERSLIPMPILLAAHLADAHAGRIVAVGPIGRRAAGADPFLAALVAALLLLEPLLERLHQLVPTAKRFDQLLLLV